jgi:hypothetical protein
MITATGRDPAVASRGNSTPRTSRLGVALLRQGSFLLVGAAVASPALSQSHRLEPVRSIDDERLAVPYAAVEGPRGDLFVSDPVAKGIFRVSPNGEWAEIVRLGEGPGEVLMISGVGLLGDTLNTPNPPSRSLVLLDAEGAFVGQIRIDPASLWSPGAWFFPVRLLPSGGVLTAPSVFPDEIARGRLLQVPYLRHDRSGELWDTLMVRDVGGTHLTLDIGSAISPAVPEMFLSEQTVVVDNRGAFLAKVEESPSGIRITWCFLEEEVVRTQEIAVDRKRLRRRMVDTRLSGWAEDNAPRFGVQPARLRGALRASVTIPEHEPIFTAVVAGSGGYVWLRGFTVSDEVVWTRYSAAGDPAMEVVLRARDRILDARDDWIWVLRRDEWDVARLLKLRAVPIRSSQ